MPAPEVVESELKDKCEPPPEVAIKETETERDVFVGGEVKNGKVGRASASSGEEALRQSMHDAYRALLHTHSNGDVAHPLSNGDVTASVRKEGRKASIVSYSDSSGSDDDVMTREELQRRRRERRARMRVSDEVVTTSAVTPSYDALLVSLHEDTSDAAESELPVVTRVDDSDATPTKQPRRTSNGVRSKTAASSQATKRSEGLNEADVAALLADRDAKLFSDDREQLLNKQTRSKAMAVDLREQMLLQYQAESIVRERKQRLDDYVTPASSTATGSESIASERRKNNNTAQSFDSVTSSQPAETTPALAAAVLPDSPLRAPEAPHAHASPASPVEPLTYDALQGIAKRWRQISDQTSSIDDDVTPPAPANDDAPTKETCDAAVPSSSDNRTVANAKHSPLSSIAPTESLEAQRPRQLSLTSSFSSDAPHVTSPLIADNTLTQQRNIAHRNQSHNLVSPNKNLQRRRASSSAEEDSESGYSTIKRRHAAQRQKTDAGARSTQKPAIDSQPIRLEAPLANADTDGMSGHSGSDREVTRHSPEVEAGASVVKRKSEVECDAIRRIDELLLSLNDPSAGDDVTASPLPISPSPVVPSQQQSLSPILASSSTPARFPFAPTSSSSAAARTPAAAAAAVASILDSSPIHTFNDAFISSPDSRDVTGASDASPSVNTNDLVEARLKNSRSQAEAFERQPTTDDVKVEQADDDVRDVENAEMLDASNVVEVFVSDNDDEGGRRSFTVDERFVTKGRRRGKTSRTGDATVTSSASESSFTVSTPSGSVANTSSAAELNLSPSSPRSSVVSPIVTSLRTPLNVVTAASSLDSIARINDAQRDASLSLENLLDDNIQALANTDMVSSSPAHSDVTTHRNGVSSMLTSSKLTRASSVKNDRVSSNDVSKRTPLKVSPAKELVSASRDVTSSRGSDAAVVQRASSTPKSPGSRTTRSDSIVLTNRCENKLNTCNQGSNGCWPGTS